MKNVVVAKNIIIGRYNDFLDKNIITIPGNVNVKVRENGVLDCKIYGILRGEDIGRKS